MRMIFMVCEFQLETTQVGASRLIFFLEVESVAPRPNVWRWRKFRKQLLPRAYQLLTFTLHRWLSFVFACLSDSLTALLSAVRLLWELCLISNAITFYLAFLVSALSLQPIRDAGQVPWGDTKLRDPNRPQASSWCCCNRSSVTRCW